MTTKKPRKKRTKKEKIYPIPIKFESSPTGIPVFWIGDDRVHFCQTDKTEKGYKSVIINGTGTDLIKVKDKKSRVPIKVRESNHTDIEFKGLPVYIGNDNPAFKLTLDKLKKVFKKHSKNGVIHFEKVKDIIKDLENAHSV